MLQESRQRLIAAYEQEEQRRPPPMLDEKRMEFLEEFSPDRLRKIKGRSMLNFIHGTVPRQGLLYQLEFGRVSVDFGSVAGGSSLKYRVYRASSGEWMTRGHGPRPVPCSEADAILITEELGRALGAAVHWADEMNLGRGKHDAWAEFQRRTRIERHGRGEFSGLELGWMHKYLALARPDLFSFHHSSGQLARHLVRLLQRPEPERYLLDWQWREFRMREQPFRRMHPVVLSHAAYSPAGFGFGANYWRIECADDWSAMRRDGFVGVEWGEVGDLREQLEFASGKAARRRLREIVGHSLRDHPIGPEKLSKQLLQFYSEMQSGDRVAAMQGNTLLGVGTIDDRYVFSGNETLPHRRNVRWLWTGSEEWEGAPVSTLALYDFSDRYEQSLFIEQLLAERGAEPMTEVLPVETTPLTPLDTRIKSILERKKQVILFGPPGTGKTYHAQRTARELISREIFDERSWATLDKAEKQQVDGHIHFCTFHPALGYEDFIEGFKPASEGSEHAFERIDGLFLEVCSAAAGDASPHVLLIDEINRGNVAAVFGELITLLEADKREAIHLKLPVSRRDFTVPKNLWIIGTMNTADRSISLLDAALRRRFGFVELMPDPTRLDRSIEGLHLGTLLAVINDRVRRHVPRNARELQVGHAYFMKKEGGPIDSIIELQEVMRDDVLPLLGEYCFENYGALADILGPRLVDAAAQTLESAVIDDPERLHLALLELVAEAHDIQSESEASDDTEEEVEEIE